MNNIPEVFLTKVSEAFLGFAVDLDIE